MRAAPYLIPALLALCTSSAAAQRAGILPGDRVRVTAPVQFDGDVGQVVSVRESGITFRQVGAADSVAIPWASIERLQVSRGMHRPVIKRMGTGLLLGALLGFAIGTVNGDVYDGEDSVSDRAGSTALALGGIGAAVGFVIGVMRPTDRWEEVPLEDASVGLKASPRGGGLALAASLRF